MLSAITKGLLLRESVIRGSTVIIIVTVEDATCNMFYLITNGYKTRQNRVIIIFSKINAIMYSLQTLKFHYNLKFDHFLKVMSKQWGGQGATKHSHISAFAGCLASLSCSINFLRAIFFSAWSVSLASSTFACC